MLTNKERVVLKLVALGCSNRDIAVKSGVAVDTVKWHLKNVYEKLCVNSRTEAVAKILYLSDGLYEKSADV